MKEKIHNPQPLLLQEGYFIDQKFTNYDELVEASDNWEHHCTYQLLPNGITGHHQILQLHSMQLGYAKRSGGMMNNAVTAKDCLSFAVFEESEDKICLDRVKIQRGNIVFFDDSKSFSFMSNAHVKFCVVNIETKNMGILKSKISKALFHTIKDTNNIMSKTLRDIWKQYTHKNDAKRNYQATEDTITTVLTELLNDQTPVYPKLTKGEEIALCIRDQIYDHMDGKISIESLAKEHQVSEKTLQNSFKSLFGFTPKLFLRLLKLNHVNHELRMLNATTGKVSNVALKWGFTHMGSFSKYYTELFGDNPSHTLKNNYSQKEFIAETCASRQEEII